MWRKLPVIQYNIVSRLKFNIALFIFLILFQNKSGKIRCCCCRKKEQRNCGVALGLRGGLPLVPLIERQLNISIPCPVHQSLFVCGRCAALVRMITRQQKYMDRQRNIFMKLKTCGRGKTVNERSVDLVSEDVNHAKITPSQNEHYADTENNTSEYADGVETTTSQNYHHVSKEDTTMLSVSRNKTEQCEKTLSQNKDLLGAANDVSDSSCQDKNTNEHMINKMQDAEASMTDKIGLTSGTLTDAASTVSPKETVDAEIEDGTHSKQIASKTTGKQKVDVEEENTCAEGMPSKTAGKSDDELQSGLPGILSYIYYLNLI